MTAPYPRGTMYHNAEGRLCTVTAVTPDGLYVSVHVAGGREVRETVTGETVGRGLFMPPEGEV